MTNRESLLAVSAYPIPMRTIEAISLKRGVDLDAVTTSDGVSSGAYRLALADLYVWLFFAPDVAQGGQSYSFTNAQRDWWKRQALAIYDELGDEDDLSALGSQYGYMGHKL